MAKPKQMDGVFRTRSLGVPSQGLPDQYADGKAAQVWSLYVGSAHSRTQLYSNWLVDYLSERGANTVVDVACGTGVDSVMLLEKGFAVTSCDASDKMLKYALKERWNRRKEPAFDQWVIEEANWLTLEDDFKDIPHPNNWFDAVVCLGNSFPHLPDFDGNQTGHRAALANMWHLVAPGGVLIVDHRNYDEILDTGVVPIKNLYYNSDHIDEIKCSNLYVNGKPQMTTLDYSMDVTGVPGLDIPINSDTGRAVSTFRLSYYPHRVAAFGELVRSALGAEAEHTVLADFKPVSESVTPAYYIHVIHKPKSFGAPVISTCQS